MWWLWGQATLALLRATQSSILPPFSFHRSSSPFSDRSHLAWQREWSTKSQPSQVWPLCATQRSARVNKMHAHTCTKYLLPTSPQPPKAVTWLLTHRSCSPAVLHYDKYTGVMGSCQPGVSHQIL